MTRESPASWAAIAVSILSNCTHRFSYSSSLVSFADAEAVLVDEAFVDDEAADFGFFLLFLLLSYQVRIVTKKVIPKAREKLTYQAFDSSDLLMTEVKVIPYDCVM